MTMKLVKKFKRKIGLAKSTGVANNAPALRFHQVHGDNIRLSNDRTVARRVESFCKGITFSNRPVKPNEKIFLKIVELKDCWNGVIRFGFTNNDPANCRGCLPKYACPDLTNKPGYWAKALSERHASADAVVHFSYTTSGDILYGVDGEDRGVLLQDVDTRNPLWMLLDIYGNSSAVEIVDVRDHLNNSRRNLDHESLVVGGGSGGEMERWVTPAMSALTIGGPAASDEDVVSSAAMVIETGVRTSPPRNYLSEANEFNASTARVAATPPPPQPSSSSSPRSPPTSSANQLPKFTAPNISFHGTRGKNAKLNDYQNVAWRDEREFCNGYVFSSRPVCPGESVVVQVRHVASVFAGSLGFGLTSCDPAKLRTCDLTDDADALLDRPEYWVVMKDVAGSPQVGDTLCFTLSGNGAVLFSKNNSPPRTVLHVDTSPSLWMFFDLYGSTQKIAVVGHPSAAAQPSTPPNCSSVPRSAPVTPWNNNNNGGPHHHRGVAVHRGSPVAAPAAGSHHVLVSHHARSQPQLASLTLSRPSPPPHQNGRHPHHAPIGAGQQHQHAATLRPRSFHVSGDQLVVIGGGGSGSPSNNRDFTRRQQMPHRLTPPPPPPPQTTESVYETLAPLKSLPEKSSSAAATAFITGSPVVVPSVQQPPPPAPLPDIAYDECTICCEKAVDSVLYMCGHMCMCYECAIQQWRGRGGGQCPICRAVIRDVIRTYRP